MQVVNRQARAFPRTGLERLRELAEVICRERHSKNSGNPGDSPQRLERFDLTLESSLDSADLIVGRFVAVQADGDDGHERAASGDPLDACHNAVGQKSVGWKMQQRQASPAC